MDGFLDKGVLRQIQAVAGRIRRIQRLTRSDTANRVDALFQAA